MANAQHDLLERLGRSAESLWHSSGALQRLLVFLLLAGCLWTFAAITDEMLEGDSLAFDRTVLLALRTGDDLSDPLGPLWLEEAVRDMTALGGTAVLTLIVVATLGFLLIERKPRTAGFLLIAVLGGLIMTLAMKAGFDRPRPDFLPHGQEVYTASFPSGHSMNSAIVYLLLGAILAQAHRARAIKVYVMSLAIIITAMVGLSRVYLGVHWPTDVLAGWTLGAAWALLCWLLIDRMQRRRVVEGESDGAGDGHPRPLDQDPSPGGDRHAEAPGAEPLVQERRPVRGTASSRR